MRATMAAQWRLLFFANYIEEKSSDPFLPQSRFWFSVRVYSRVGQFKIRQALNQPLLKILLAQHKTQKLATNTSTSLLRNVSHRTSYRHMPGRCS
jgi:hypothetical protein